jgi:hypothetical protein
MKKVVILFSVFMGLAMMAQAQFSQFHVGFGFPQGKFADGNEKTDELTDGKGFAAMGFTIGYKRYNPLSVENLSWVFSIDVFYNGLNSDYKDAVEDNNWQDITYPMYFNFPATFGLNYAIPINGENLKIYGEMGLGANFSMITNFSLGDRPNYQDMEIKITPAFKFAYGLEGGLFINKKYTIGLRYNNFGSYKYKYETDYETSETKKGKYNKALPITNISLSAGVLF